MNAQISTPKISAQEYFELELTAEFRREYVTGQIIELNGDTPQNNRIVMNIALIFDRALDEGSYSVYVVSIRLRIAPDLYRYADVIVDCGESVTDAANSLFPDHVAALIEVSSPETERTDRGRKQSEYRSLPALTDYIVVAQDRVFVEHHIRQSATQWTIVQYSRLDDVLTFESLGVTMSLREVYRRTPLASVQETAPTETSA